MARRSPRRPTVWERRNISRLRSAFSGLVVKCCKDPWLERDCCDDVAWEHGDSEDDRGEVKRENIDFGGHG